MALRKTLKKWYFSNRRKYCTYRMFWFYYKIVSVFNFKFFLLNLDFRLENNAFSKEWFCNTYCSYVSWNEKDDECNKPVYYRATLLCVVSTYEDILFQPVRLNYKECKLPLKKCLQKKKKWLKNGYLYCWPSLVTA